LPPERYPTNPFAPEKLIN